MVPSICRDRLSLIYCYVLFVFFFKQKTAYDMRISDCSSDVCSSDLFVTEQGDSLLLDCEAARAGDLLRRLKLYKLRAQVTVEPVEDLEIGRASCRERVCQYV